MNPFLPITDIYAREILDSRGNPTVEVEVVAGEHYHGVAQVPSGISTGSHEAVELRDGESRYHGMGVRKAVSAVNDKIVREIMDVNVFEQKEIDKILCKLDGNEKKKSLGVNAMLGVSLAVARCGADAAGLPLYRYLGGVREYTLPIPVMNLINGGRHADNMLDFQEFLILPVGMKRFEDAIRCGTEVYHTLKQILEQDGKSTAVGDEGGFAPQLRSAEEAFQYLVYAIEEAGYEPGRQVVLGMDVSANGLYNMDSGLYKLTGTDRRFSTEAMIDYYESLCETFPVRSIEDGLWEDDWRGWQELTKRLGGRVQIVGDDFFVTDKTRLEKGVAEKCGNAVLIKPNQRGTLSETMETIQAARKAGYEMIVSHRSGDTEDTIISDMAVAFGCGQIKAGAPCRSERVAKYNRLLKIEEELSRGCAKSAIY